jgi:hypothetical protein
MFSPTAASMAYRDPRPIVDQIIKICYSEEKFHTDIRNSKNLSFIARGISENGAALEFHANNIYGYKGEFAVFRWEKTPEGEVRICKIVRGQNFELSQNIKRPSANSEQIHPAPELDKGPEKPDEEKKEAEIDIRQLPEHQGEDDDDYVVKYKMLDLESVPSTEKSGNQEEK